jgi:regulator of sirC expression with transglutaminase-like and TPR domain
LPGVELTRIVGDACPSFEQVAFAIERDLDHRADVAASLSALDAWAASIPRPGTFADVTRLLYDVVGLRCATDYDDPAWSYLSTVVTRRQGLPVLLATVAIAVAERVGVALEPIAFPGHFLLRDRETRIYIDPASGRYPLAEDELLKVAKRVHKDPAVAALRLEPVDARGFAVRVLQNLTRALGKRGDHARSFVVYDRLVELTGSPEHRCDRAAHALALGSVDAAIDDFQAYLEACPHGQDRERVERLLSEARGRRRRPLN